MTVPGAVELATTAEIDTGTDSTRAIPIDQYVASKRNVRHVVIRVLEAATDITTGTTKGGDFRLPTITGTIVDCGGWTDTAPTGTMICAQWSDNGLALGVSPQVNACEPVDEVYCCSSQ